MYSWGVEFMRENRIYIAVMVIVISLLVSLGVILMMPFMLTPENGGEDIDVRERQILSEDRSEVLMEMDWERTTEFSVRSGEDSAGLDIEYIASFDSETGEASYRMPEDPVEKTASKNWRGVGRYIQYSDQADHVSYYKLTQYSGSEVREGAFNPEVFECVSDDGSTKFEWKTEEVDRTVFGAMEGDLIESIDETLLWFERRPSGSGSLYVVPEKRYTSSSGLGHSLLIEIKESSGGIHVTEQGYVDRADLEVELVMWESMGGPLLYGMDFLNIGSNETVTVKYFVDTTSEDVSVDRPDWVRTVQDQCEMSD